MSKYEVGDKFVVRIEDINKTDIGFYLLDVGIEVTEKQLDGITYLARRHPSHLRPGVVQLDEKDKPRKKKRDLPKFVHIMPADERHSPATILALDEDGSVWGYSQYDLCWGYFSNDFYKENIEEWRKERGEN